MRLDEVATVHDTHAERTQAALLDGRPSHKTEVYSVDHLHGMEPLLSDIYADAKAQGIPAETIISEYAPGQYELTLNYRTGAVLAYVGSANYYATSTKPEFQPQYDVVGNQTGRTVFLGAGGEQRDLEVAVGGHHVELLGAAAVGREDEVAAVR